MAGSEELISETCPPRFSDAIADGDHESTGNALALVEARHAITPTRDAASHLGHPSRDAIPWSSTPPTRHTLHRRRAPRATLVHPKVLGRQRLECRVNDLTQFLAGGSAHRQTVRLLVGLTSFLDLLHADGATPKVARDWVAVGREEAAHTVLNQFLARVAARPQGTDRH